MARKKQDSGGLHQEAVEKFCNNLENMGWLIAHLAAAAREVVRSDLTIAITVKLVTDKRAIDRDTVEDTLRGLAEMFETEDYQRDPLTTT